MTRKLVLFIFTIAFIVFISGCSSAESVDHYWNEYEEVDTEPVAPDPVTVDPVLAGGDEVQSSAIPALENRKIIYSATLKIETPTPETVYNDVVTNLDVYSAYIESADITTSRYIVRIRVLSINFTDFVEEIKTSGELLSFTKSSRDVTNSYSTFEARKLALETQHTRILELISVAENLNNILILEDARFKIETELNQINQSLANYDSLVDYSTIDLTIYKTVETEIILPRTEDPFVHITDITKNSAEIEIFNQAEESVVIFVDLLQNGEFIRQYEETAYGDSKVVINIGDLKSNKDYTIKVTAISDSHRESYIISRNIETYKTFFNKVGNIFVISFNSLVYIFEFIGLTLVAIAPFGVTAFALFIPSRLVYKKLKPKLDKRRIRKEEKDENINEKNEKHL